MLNFQELYEVYTADPAPGPDKRVEAHLRLQTVHRVLQTLPEVDRAAFVLRVQHELPYAEIARVLELSLTAVKVKVHRIRKKLLAACVEKEVYGSLFKAKRFMFRRISQPPGGCEPPGGYATAVSHQTAVGNT